MTFEKLFVSLDMLAPPIELSIGGQKSYRTKFGGILTVCLLGCLTTAVVFILKHSLRNDIPISYSENTNGRDYPTYNLADSNHIPVLAFYANETETMTTDMFPKYFTADCMHVTWGGSTDAAGNYMMTRDVKLFPVKPCKDLTPQEKRYLNYADRSSTFVTLIEDSGMCVVPDENFWISGKNSDDVFVELVFRLRPCSLSSGCVNYTQISKVNFYLGLPTTNIDLTNYENPYSQSLTADDLYYVNPTINQMLRFSMRTVDIWDLSTLLATWMPKLTFTEIARSFFTSTDRRSNNLHCPPELVNLIDDREECQSYIQFNFQSSGGRTKIKRRYKSYTEIFGEIGGVKELLIMGFAFLYVWPNKQSFKKFVSKELASMSDHTIKKPEDGDALPQTPKKQNVGMESASLEHSSNHVMIMDLSTNPLNEASTSNLKQQPPGPERAETKSEKPPSKSTGASCRDLFSVCIKGTTTSSEDEILADTLDVIWMIRELHKWRILGQLIFTKEQLHKLPRIVAKMQQNPQLGFDELAKSPILDSMRTEIFNAVDSLHSRPVSESMPIPLYAELKGTDPSRKPSQDKTQVDLDSSKVLTSLKNTTQIVDGFSKVEIADKDPSSVIVAKYFGNEEKVKHVSRGGLKANQNKVFSYSPKPPSARPLQPPPRPAPSPSVWPNNLT